MNLLQALSAKAKSLFVSKINFLNFFPLRRLSLCVFLTRASRLIYFKYSFLRLAMSRDTPIPIEIVGVGVYIFLEGNGEVIYKQNPDLPCL
jgi:hypothetical protein